MGSKLCDNRKTLLNDISIYVLSRRSFINYCKSSGERRPVEQTFNKHIEISISCSSAAASAKTDPGALVSSVIVFLAINHIDIITCERPSGSAPFPANLLGFENLSSYNCKCRSCLGRMSETCLGRPRAFLS